MIPSYMLAYNMTGESAMPVEPTQTNKIARALSQVAAEGGKFMSGGDEAREKLPR